LGAKVIWAAENEPIKLFFDSSRRERTCHLYFSTNAPTESVEWEPRAGIILETRERLDSPMTSLDQMRQIWMKSPGIFGRSRVSRIFDGIHHHGPSQNYVARYLGYFSIAHAGDYMFATVSENASFLLIDGRSVAEWPGWHDVSGGLRGERHGSVSLGIGTHSIDYFRVQANLNSTAEVAWRPPGKDRFEVMPANVFVPVSAFHSVDWTAAPARKDCTYFEWEMLEHTTAGETTLVTAEFRPVPSGPEWSYRWTFDDQVTVMTNVARHTFLRAGVHAVRLDVMDKNHSILPTEQKVLVHPRWLQQEEFPQGVFERQKKEIMGRDTDSVPTADLMAAVKFANAIEDKSWLTSWGDVCLTRRKEFFSDAAETFYALAFHYQHADVRRYDEAAQAFQIVLDLKPEDKKLEARARLHYAGLLIHCFLKPDEAKNLLSALNANDLSELDQRLLRIYAADALLAKGDEQGATAAYLAIPTTVERSNTMYAVRRSARLESARNYLKRGEYDAAWKAAKDIEWETPIERMGTQTGFPIVQAHRGRREAPLALTRCILLLNAGVTGEDQAQLLYFMIEIYESMGQKEHAITVLDRLLKDHPHSEPAARAKELFARTVRAR
jgi:tetratricopeptide (TPR) repeat protein